MSVYTLQLESLLGKIIEQFDYDPSLGEYVHENEEGGEVRVSAELAELLDRANDLVYGPEGSDEETFEDGI